MSTITVDEVLRVIESTPTIIVPEVAASRPPTVAVLEEIIAAIRTELDLQSPNVVTLHALMIEMQTTQARLMHQAAKEIRETGQTTQLGTTPEQIKETVAKIQRLTKNVVAGSEALTLRLTQGIGSSTAGTVDNAAMPSDDEKMNATTDKDYIDARLKAMSDSLDQRLETAAAKSDGRLEVIETRMDARMAALDAKLATGIAAMDAKLDANFARFESMLHKSTADIHKATTDTLSRVIAIVSGLVGVGIAVIVLVINNMAPKPASVASAPVVIYAQPAPPTTTTPPQVLPAPAAKP